MIKQTLAVVGLAMTAMAVVVAPAAAVGNSDGSTNSLQGHGGTDVTSTHGRPGLFTPGGKHVDLIGVTAVAPAWDVR